jgi:hypothetical protein
MELEWISVLRLNLISSAASELKDSIKIWPCKVGEPPIPELKTPG